MKAQKIVCFIFIISVAYAWCQTSVDARMEEIVYTNLSRRPLFFSHKNHSHLSSSVWNYIKPNQTYRYNHPMIIRDDNIKNHHSLAENFNTYKKVVQSEEENRTNDDNQNSNTKKEKPTEPNEIIPSYIIPDIDIPNTGDMEYEEYDSANRMRGFNLTSTFIYNIFLFCSILYILVIVYMLRFNI